MGRIYDTTSNGPVEYLSTAETAKLVRAALKRAFPGVKFSVRSHNYSGGSSIYVSYTDGPTDPEVRQVVRRYEGADFDGMIDLKTYRGPVEQDGRLVSMGTDYILITRTVSPEFVTNLRAEWEARYGMTYDPDKTYTNLEASIGYPFPEDTGYRLLERFAAKRSALATEVTTV